MGGNRALEDAVIVAHPHSAPHYALYPTHPNAYRPKQILPEQVNDPTEEEELELEVELSTRIWLPPDSKLGFKKVSPFAKKVY